MYVALSQGLKHYSRMFRCVYMLSTWEAGCVQRGVLISVYMVGHLLNKRADRQTRYELLEREQHVASISRTLLQESSDQPLSTPYEQNARA